jgi:AraC-like DNA-binding protein
MIVLGTNEYMLGNGELAVQLGCKKLNYGNGIEYRLPPENGDSWLIDIHPAPGLFVTNAYFKLLEPVTREYDIQQMCIWLCSFDRGDVTIIEKGKKARHLQQGIHVVVNRGQPVKVIFASNEPIWYTSVLVFDNFIASYLKDRALEQPFSLPDAAAWESTQYNTPDLVMVFEQIKYAVRGATVPPLYYESKIGELLALILRNVQHEWHWKNSLEKSNQNKITYQDMKYIWQVKAELDKNMLAPPTIKQLTNIAEMGSTKLRHCFKLLYKVTIADYVREGKMKHAMRLLSHDDMSIHNIATAVGYDSASKFTAAFKKIHGLTPSEFRKSFRL